MMTCHITLKKSINFYAQFSPVKYEHIASGVISRIPLNTNIVCRHGGMLLAIIQLLCCVILIISRISGQIPDFKSMLVDLIHMSWSQWEVNELVNIIEQAMETNSQTKADCFKIFAKMRFSMPQGNINLSSKFSKLSIWKSIF